MTAKKSSKARAVTKKSKARGGLKDPSGGLTSKGRAYFKNKEGAQLKPGVKGKADTPEKMRRKGSFLRRHYANLRGPLKDEKGEPTRLALQAHAWGEKVPSTKAQADALARKGTRLLEKYQLAKERGARAGQKTARTKTVAKKKSAARVKRKTRTATKARNGTKAKTKTKTKAKTGAGPKRTSVKRQS
jgi:hypothetical protein